MDEVPTGDGDGEVVAGADAVVGTLGWGSTQSARMSMSHVEMVADVEMT